MKTQTIQNSIKQMSLQEQIVLLEDILQNMKNKVFTRIESTDPKHLKQIFKVLQLNSDVFALHSIVEQLPEKNIEKTVKVLGNAKTVDKEEEEYQTHLAALKEKYKDLPITWPENKPNPDDFFGIWKDRNITLEEIREKAWKRK